MSGDATELATWVAAYVAEASRDENVEAFVQHVNDRIRTAIPVLEQDPVLAAELHASTKSQFQVFLSLLEREKQELLLPPQAIDLALSIARRQLELGVLLQVYREAAAAVWEVFAQVAHDVPDDGPDRTAVLVYLWDHGGTWINEAIEQLIGVFYEEREATMHGALARRTETVHALLRGEALGMDAATVDLGHQLRAHQTALVLWSAKEGSADTLVVLNELASALASATSSSALSVPAGRGEVWCWLSSRTPPTPEALRAVVDDAARAGVRVAAGTTAPGIEGFRMSHREAVDAQRLAVASGSRRFTSYSDVELACLMGGNLPAARDLVRRELGALAGDDRGLDRVRETVAHFLQFGGSVEQTASALTIHKNTVRYRLSQAEDLIGHPLTERRTEVALALTCLEHFGATTA